MSICNQDQEVLREKVKTHQKEIIIQIHNVGSFIRFLT